MRKRSLAIVAIFAMLFVFGCKQEFRDISTDTEFSNLIGQEYRSLQKLIIHGVTTDKNYQKRIDFYSLTSAPGIAGPEVVTVRDLSTGSQIKVKRVLECKNCMFGSPVVIVVEITSEKLSPAAPIRLYGLRVRNSKTGKVELDSNFFSKLSGA